MMPSVSRAELEMVPDDRNEEHDRGDDQEQRQAHAGANAAPKNVAMRGIPPPALAAFDAPLLRSGIEGHGDLDERQQTEQSKHKTAQRSLDHLFLAQERGGVHGDGGWLVTAPAARKELVEEWASRWIWRWSMILTRRRSAFKVTVFAAARATMIASNTKMIITAEPSRDWRGGRAMQEVVFIG